MRKLLLLLPACWLLAMSGAAQALSTTDRFTIEPVTVQPGGDYEVMCVGLDGSRIYAAYNLDILFPTGLDVYYEDGDPAVVMDEDDGIYPFTKKLGKKVFTHTVTCTYGEVRDKNLRVACTSNANDEFTAQDGSLFFVGIQASPYAKPGAAVLRLSGLNLTVKENAQKYVPVDEDYTDVTIGTQSKVSVKILATNKYSTLVLPFDAALPTGVRAFKCPSETADALLLDEVTAFEAYTPYILYASDGYEGVLTGTVDASKYVEVASEGLLYGAIVPQQVTSGYVLQNQGEGAKFYQIDHATFTIPEGRCWVQSGSNVRAFNWGDFATGITQTTVSTDAAPIYDLSGHRVSRMESGRIYVVNGQKILKR